MALVETEHADRVGNRYRLVEQLGTGGMSVVWRGYDEVLNRQVAVKVLAPALASDASFRHRIRLEAMAAARLVHPHITNVYDYGESISPHGETVPYVVMELVDGEPLSARLARDGALPWRAAVQACAEVAAALATAHARGVVHRDVTPGNVMLTSAGAKVVDFGISALVGQSDLDDDGSLLGTPAYVAPERLDGGQVSPASDVYALGLLLYRALTGQLPWQVDNTTQLLQAHLYVAPTPLPPVDGLPDAVVDVVERCLKKPPAERPASLDVARILAAVVGLPAVIAVSPAPVGASPGGDASAHTTILPWSPPPADPHAGTSDAPPPQPALSPQAVSSSLLASPSPSPSGASVAASSDRVATDPQAVTGRRPGSAPSEPGGRADDPPPDRPVRSGRLLSTGRRRAQTVAVSAGVLVAASIGWTLSQAGQPPDATRATGAAPGGGPAAACLVRYEVGSDSGGRYQAALTVRNNGDTPLRDWQLEFAFRAENNQQILGRRGALIYQNGNRILVRPSVVDALQPGAAVELGFTGSYQGANVPPEGFTLDGQPCGAEPAGAPALAAGAPVPNAGRVANLGPRTTTTGTSGAVGQPTGSGTSAGAGAAGPPGADAGATPGRTSTPPSPAGDAEPPGLVPVAPEPSVATPGSPASADPADPGREKGKGAEKGRGKGNGNGKRTGDGAGDDGDDDGDDGDDDTAS